MTKPAGPLKWSKFSRMLLAVMGLLILFLLAAFLSFPSLAAPVREIPAPDLAQQQLILSNTWTKTKAAAASGLLSGSGYLTLDLSAPEINALVYQGLRQKLAPAKLPAGTLVKINPDKTISADLKFIWRGHPLGLHLLAVPRTTSDGAMQVEITTLKLGKIPLPAFLVGTYLKPRLPAGVRLAAHPLRLIILPPQIPLNDFPPLVKEPRLYFVNLSTSEGYLRLTTQFVLKTVP